MTSSVNLRRSVRSGVRKKFFTSCCVIVLPPCMRPLTTRRLRAVPEDERPHRNLELVAPALEPARLLVARHVPIAKVAQLVLDVGLRNAQARMQLERPRVDACRQRETPALELVSHAHV